MNVKPDSIRYALGLLEREWGSYGYGIERVDGASGDWTGRLALVYVCASDGSRFIIAADDHSGQWGYADGESDEARAAAIEQHNRAVYSDGRWTWPPTIRLCNSCGENTPSIERGNETCDRCRDAAAIGRATTAGHTF